MLLGYNTNGLVHHRLDEALQLLGDEGFEAVALTPDVGHLDPFRTSPGDVDRIASLLQRMNLVCVVETGARFLLDPSRKHRPNLLERDPEARKVRLDFLKRCLDLAADLDATALSFWAGSLPEGVGRKKGMLFLKEGIVELLEKADQRNVLLALEPEPGMLIETVSQGVDVIEELGRPSRLGLTIDVGHLYVTGEGSPAEVLPRVAAPMRQVHVEDIRRGVHEHLAPGEGDVDFPEVWRTLESMGYDGPVCFELSRSAHAAPEMLRLARETFFARDST